MTPLLLAPLVLFPGQSVSPPPAYRIVIEPVKRVEAVLKTELTLPKVVAEEWLAIAPKPPSLPYQQLHSAVTDPPSKETKDLSPRGRPLLSGLFPVKDKKNQTMFTASAKYELTLSSRELVPLLVGEKPPVVAPLSAEEFKWYTGEGGLIDWRHKTFYEWFEKHKLKREEKEDDVNLARRIFQTLRAQVKTALAPGKDYQASALCQQAEVDPVGQAVLFVASCRASGLPARLMIGRAARSATANNNMVYVKAEFYAAGIGWIPLDVARNKFGDDPGDFVVLHIDTDVILDLPREKRTVSWLYFVHVGPTKGKGSPDGAEAKETWEVKELRKP